MQKKDFIPRDWGTSNVAFTRDTASSQVDVIELDLKIRVG